jgi:hypothetical protein
MTLHHPLHPQSKPTFNRLSGKILFNVVSKPTQIFEKAFKTYFRVIMTCILWLSIRPHNSQHNDTQQNDTQHDDTQHNDA